MAAVRNGITHLRQSYFTPPFKVANITEDKKDPFLHLMLMCSSPGILDGDEHVIRVELEEQSRLQLHTQSYQRLFHMKKGAAQSMEVCLKKGASFCYLPHPSVPHEHSIFTGRNKIFLSGGCHLVWGEVLTCGRKLSGEVFTFSKYHSVTDVFMDGGLVLRENVCLRPSVMDMYSIGQLEGFTHQASLLAVGEGSGDDPVRAAIRAHLSGQEGIVYGISTGPVNSLVVRVLGNKAEQLHDCMKTMAGLLFCIEPSAYAS